MALEGFEPPTPGFLLPSPKEGSIKGCCPLIKSPVLYQTELQSLMILRL